MAGVEVSGTSLDPRRDLSAIKRYNSRQLNAYIRELNSFTARSTGYVGGAESTVLDRRLWNQYKRLERQVNALSDAQSKMAAGKIIPGTGMTIAQREATIVPERRAGIGEAVARPYSRYNRQPGNINGNDKLRALIAQMQKKLSPDYLPRELAKQRVQMADMLDIIGSSSLREKAAKLTDAQFNILWNLTPFARAMSGVYEHHKAKARDVKEENWALAVYESQNQDANELIDWAATLESGTDNASPAKPKAKRKRGR